MRGFDHLAVNQGLLLCLPFHEGAGTITRDFAKPHHEMTLNGCVWTPQANDLMVLDFIAPDWLDCPAVDTADLNFIAGDFSLAMWIEYGGSGERNLFCRGLINVDGWTWYVGHNEDLRFRTNQAAATQLSTSADDLVPIGEWAFVAVTRSGEDATFYGNGVQSVGTPVAHTNPLTSARELHVGINDAETASWFDGLMWGARIWGRALTADEIRFIFEMERDWFGV